MKQLRITDNSFNSKEGFLCVKNVTDKIADVTLDELERRGVFLFPQSIEKTGDLSGDQMILKSVNDGFMSGNVMGFIGYGEERLVIESRFAEGSDYFLTYLLSKVMDFPNIVDLHTDYDRDNPLFAYLIFLFPLFLEKAMRKGLFKKYIRNEYNDANIRGSIDISRHITKNTPFVGKIAYSRREYSYDNDLTELIRHTMEYIWQKPYGRAALLRVKDETDTVIEATGSYSSRDRQRILSANKRHAVSHAYYHEYRDLQKLCILILQHENHLIGSGMRQIYGVLFDGAWLWEEYVNTLLSDRFYHPMNKKGKGAQRLFAGGIGRIYPDFISKDAECRMICDAKYKPQENIGNKDYLQVLAYMFRFDAKRAFYLYPEKGETKAQTLWLNQGSTYEKNVSPRDDVCLRKLGFQIPSEAAGYDDFANKMMQREEEFKRAVCSKKEELP